MAKYHSKIMHHAQLVRLIRYSSLVFIFTLQVLVICDSISPISRKIADIPNIPLVDSSVNNVQIGKNHGMQSFASDKTTEKEVQGGYTDSTSASNRALESVSPSTISTFYNLVNKIQGGDQQDLGQLSLKSKNKPDQLQQYVQTQGPVALGFENQIVGAHQMDATSYTAPILIASGINAAASSIIGGSPMIGEPTVAQSNGRDQVLASFYVDDYGNQMVNMQPQIHPSDSTTNVYGPQNSPFYNQAFYSPQQSSTMMSPKTPQMQNIHNDRSISGKHPAQISELKQDRREKLLSNDQLASLIDELKEFNSRQASKIRTSLAPAARQRSTRNNGRTNDQGGSSDQGDEQGEDGKSDDEPKEEGANEEDKMNAHDLAKFAKFLLTKEGANMKFNLGLDKDSPDDGDEEDDRDKLLESKKKNIRAKPKSNRSKDLEELDERHSEIASKMDKIMGAMNEKAKAADRARKRDSQSNSDRNNENDDDNMDKARSKRDRDTSRSKLHNRETVISRRPGTKFDRRHRENFAKMLMNQELAEDQQDSKSEPSNDKRALELAHKIERPSKKIRRSNDVHPESTSIDVNVSPEQQTPVDETINNHDYALIHELDRARKDKESTRTRLPLRFNELVKKALDGGMGLRVEKKPERKLVLHDKNRKPLLKLELPEGSVKQSSNDAKLVDSELIPTRAEPNPGRSSKDTVIRAQSAQPLEDEYPISERVGDRLNKLSNNLDRFFNDSFMKEIETKSEFVGANVSHINDHHQAQPTIVEPMSGEEKDKHVHEGEEDRDFDVNVTIDGKRDMDLADDDSDKEDETSDKDEEEHDRLKASKVRNNKVAMKRDPKLVNLKKVPSAQEKKGSPKMRKIESEKSFKIGTARKKEAKVQQRKDNKFKSNRRTRPSQIDPVESESLDTPIGPDTEADRNPTTRRGSKTKRPQEITSPTKPGKKAITRFYEEPDWDLDNRSKRVMVN